MIKKQTSNRCQGKTKQGQPCRAAATAGGLCYFHANPSKASELGCVGGRKNRRVPAEVATALPNLDSILAVRNTVAQVIAEVYAGRLNPRIATSLSPLLGLQLRTIETSELERRLAALEKQVATEVAKGEEEDEDPPRKRRGGLRGWAEAQAPKQSSRKPGQSVGPG